MKLVCRARKRAQIARMVNHIGQVIATIADHSKENHAVIVGRIRAIQEKIATIQAIAPVKISMFFAISGF